MKFSGESRAQPGGKSCELPLDAGATPLITEEDQIGPAADAKLSEKVRNMEFHGSLGNVQAVGHFFVRKIFEQTVQNLLLAPAEFGG